MANSYSKQEGISKDDLFTKNFTYLLKWVKSSSLPPLAYKLFHFLFHQDCNGAKFAESRVIWFLFVSHQPDWHWINEMPPSQWTCKGIRLRLSNERPRVRGHAASKICPRSYSPGTSLAFIHKWNQKLLFEYFEGPIHISQSCPLKARRCVYMGYVTCEICTNSQQVSI
jgi:hypothetical protein